MARRCYEQLGQVIELSVVQHLNGWFPAWFTLLQEYLLHNMKVCSVLTSVLYHQSHCNISSILVQSSEVYSSESRWGTVGHMVGQPEDWGQAHCMGDELIRNIVSAIQSK